MNMRTYQDPLDPDTTRMEIKPAARVIRPVSRWERIRRSVFATIGAAGVWLAAILCIQPSVTVDPLPLRHVSELRWVLTNDCTITISNVTMTIRAGFESDLASIGKLSYPLGLRNDSPCLRRAALAHDGLYALMDKDGNGPISRELTDTLLYIGCIEDGTTPKKAEAVKEAVSIWGWAAVRKHTPESVERARKLVSVTVSPLRGAP